MAGATEVPRKSVWNLLLARRWALTLAATAAILALISALIWRWIPRHAEQPSIVVLPFDDLSPTRDNEYSAVGLTDEIIGKLSQVRALKVISRTTAMALKEIREAARYYTARRNQISR